MEVRGRVRIVLANGQLIIEPAEQGEGAVVLSVDEGEARPQAQPQQPAQQAPAAQAAQQPQQQLTVKDMILNYARERKGPFTIEQAAEDLGLSYSSVSSYLSWLARRGLLRRVGRGTYEAAKK